MAKFAIIETGGKQYKIGSGDKLAVEKLAVKEGEKVKFDKVLMTVDGDTVKIGTPYLAGVAVEADVLRQGRDKKKIVFRYHSKVRYRKKKGHRQAFTEVKAK